RAEKFLQGKGIFVALRQEDFAEAGAIMPDSEDVVNLPLKVGGVEVSVIVIEQPDGSSKASFRSRCGLDAAKLASEFGGGGHRAAAGAAMACGLDEACAAIKAKTAEYYAALQ
ncbi:MAG: bifunctional oligoribonuclease/PAP phosphatase NrnA, partial [Thermoguttaceae bacterium]|nr:bifunctional oligoribonuclease/PAP phosphatase NrnA [Thermoguttaceae bacterium]